jgi:hypothetical protein
MQYKHLGRTGLQVSRLCLGTMNLNRRHGEPPARQAPLRRRRWRRPGVGVTAARGAAPRRGRRFAGSRRSRPPERRVARRAHTHSGRASRFPRSWRGQRPTRPRSPCRSSPSWPDVRGPRQTAAVIRHDSPAGIRPRARRKRSHSFDGSERTTPRGLGARRTGILSLHAVVRAPGSAGDVGDAPAGRGSCRRRPAHAASFSRTVTSWSAIKCAQSPGMSRTRRRRRGRARTRSRRRGSSRGCRARRRARRADAPRRRSVAPSSRRSPSRRMIWPLRNSN